MPPSAKWCSCCSASVVIPTVLWTQWNSQTHKESSISCEIYLHGCAPAFFQKTSWKHMESIQQMRLIAQVHRAALSRTTIGSCGVLLFSRMDNLPTGLCCALRWCSRKTVLVRKLMSSVEMVTIAKRRIHKKRSCTILLYLRQLNASLTMNIAQAYQNTVHSITISLTSETCQN